MNRKNLLQFLLAVIAGCVIGGAAIWARTGSIGLDSAAARGGSPTEGLTMADFTLPDLHGRQVNFTKFAAGRPFVVSFGQISCPACRDQSREFEKLHDRYGDRVALLKIHIQENPRVVARHVTEMNGTTRTLIDADGSIYGRYANMFIPRTLVGDAAGNLVKVANFMPADEIARLLDDAL